MYHCFLPCLDVDTGIKNPGNEKSEENHIGDGDDGRAFDDEVQEEEGESRDGHRQANVYCSKMKTEKERIYCKVKMCFQDSDNCWWKWGLYTQIKQEQ